MCLSVYTIFGVTGDCSCWLFAIQCMKVQICLTSKTNPNLGEAILVFKLGLVGSTKALLSHGNSPYPWTWTVVYIAIIYTIPGHTIIYAINYYIRL